MRNNFSLSYCASLCRSMIICLCSGQQKLYVLERLNEKLNQLRVEQKLNNIYANYWTWGSPINFIFI